MPAQKIKAKTNQIPGSPRDFVAPIVEAGDLEGSHPKQADTRPPLIVFYDNTYDWCVDPVDGNISGQGSTSFLISHVFDREVRPIAGMNVQGGVDAWKLDQAAFTEVHALVDQ
jgi:hypothetical protein